MQITVLMFAAAKQAAGCESVRVEVDSPARAADVIAAIGDAYPQLSDLLPACRLAVDCCYVEPDEPVTAAAEVALIPPVSGG